MLNSFADLIMETGKHRDVQLLLGKAMEINPKDPKNLRTYYRLALSHYLAGDHDRAFKTLDEMFSKTPRDETRSKPVFKEARELHKALNAQLAESQLNEMIRYVDQRRKYLEQKEGYPIRLMEDDALEYVAARTQIAWKHHRGHHEIRYRTKDPFTIPHILTHEMEHTDLEYEARRIGRNRIFTTDSETRERAIRSIQDHVYKLRNVGFSDGSVTKVSLDLIHGLANQLFNSPLDMVIEKRLYESHEPLRPSQFLSLLAFQTEHLAVVTNPEIRELSPPSVYRASVTLNCASALCVDHIYKGKTEYTTSYKKLDVFGVGKQLFEIWRDAMKNYRHGDEYDLVDEFARKMKLENWYKWMHDSDDGLARLNQLPARPERA